MDQYEGMHAKWDAEKETFYKGMDNKQTQYMQDYQKAKTQKQRPDPYDSKYYVLEQPVCSSSSIVKPNIFQKPNKYEINIIQKSLYLRHGVALFRKWDYFRTFSGNGNDWAQCIPGCKLHNYTPTAIEFLKKYNLVHNADTLADSKGTQHQVCRVLCEAHSFGQPSIIKSSQPGRMAQHFTQKYTKSTNSVKRKSFAYPVAILRHVNI